MARRSGDAHRVHVDVGVGRLVPVESDADATGQAHGDDAEGQVFASVHADGEVRVAGQAEIGDLDAAGVDDFDATVIGLVAKIDGAAAFEGNAGFDADGRGADRTGGRDDEALAGGCVGYSGVDGGKVVLEKTSVPVMDRWMDGWADGK